MKIRDVTTVIYVASIVCVSACDSRPEQSSDVSAQTNAGESRIVVGAEIPEFTLTALDDPAISLTRADVDGKIYLIDFWATWCLPCVAELPNLHQAYEAYSGRGFEILSIAMGDRRDEIERLRGTGWPMPWLHGFEPLDSEAAELFELFGVPMAILVDSSHTIVGLDEDVRGEQLHETLARLFGEAN